MKEEVDTKIEMSQENSLTMSNVARSSSNSVTIDEVNSKVDFLSNCYTLFEPPIGFRDKYGDFSCYPIEIYIPDSLKPYIKCVALYAMLMDDKLYIDFRYGDSLANVSQLASHGVAYYIAKNGKITNTLEIDAKHYSIPDNTIIDCGEKFYFYVDDRIVNAIKYALDRRKHAEGISGRVNTYLRPCTLTPDPTSSQEGFVLYHGDLSEKCYYLSKIVQPCICDFLENRQIVVEKNYSYQDILAPEVRSIINEDFTVQEAAFNFTRVVPCSTATEVTGTQGTLCKLQCDMHIKLSDYPNWLAIEGNGHKVNFYDSRYNTYTSNGRAKFTATDNNNDALPDPEIGSCIVDQDFNTYMISKTEPWQADCDILDEKYNSLDNPSQKYENVKILIPIKNEWCNDIRFNGNKAFVNWTSWYRSFNARIETIVIHNGQTYAKVTHKSDFFPNYDPCKFNMYTNVIVYNCYPNESNTFYYELNRVISMPINVTTAYMIKQWGNVQEWYMKNINGMCGDWNSRGINSSKSCIVDCKLIHFVSLYGVNYTKLDATRISSMKAYQTIKNTEIAFVSGCAIHGQRSEETTSHGCCQHISGCYIHNTGYSRTNVAAIHAGWHFYIHDNKMQDNGYASIIAGDNTVAPGQNLYNYPCGCIELNIFGQTEKYFYGSHNYVLTDSGCIHIKTTTNGVVIRYNTINRYGGRGWNHGIFGDDGATNVFIYENIIRQTPNGRSIDMRYAKGRSCPEELLQNGHRLVACNVTDSAIRIEGIPNETNTCDVHAFSNIRLNGNEKAIDAYNDLTTCANNLRLDGIINADCTLSITAVYNAIASHKSPLRGEENIC